MPRPQWKANEAFGQEIWLADDSRQLVFAAAEATCTQKAHDGCIVQYLGIAADEPERIARNDKPGYALPLVAIGWDEATCRKWCEDNDLLSPIYTTAARGGCWFCHNQSIGQLRLLRKMYPDLWAIMLKWDADSPVTFKPDGHTVRDFDARFAAEDAGIVPTDNTFRWAMLGLKIKPRRVEIPGQLDMFGGVAD